MQTIFISSTFQDMQQERDALHDFVLPELKEFARKYGKTIDLCDLRWGVNSSGLDEQGSAAKVLQVCFDEIDNSRPLFIGLLGERYGWVPDSSLVHAALAGQGREIPDSDDKSITEMEILYGISGPQNNIKCQFYFRELKKPLFGLTKKIPAEYLAGSSSDRKKWKT